MQPQYAPPLAPDRNSPQGLRQLTLTQTLLAVTIFSRHAISGISAVWHPPSLLQIVGSH